MLFGIKFGAMLLQGSGRNAVEACGVRCGMTFPRRDVCRDNVPRYRSGLNWIIEGAPCHRVELVAARTSPRRPP